jgi:hypothetical protein
MNNKFILLFILFLPYQITAQSYKPLLIQGNSWHNRYIPHSSPFKCGFTSNVDSSGTEILYLTVDSSLYNGKFYRNLIACYDSVKQNAGLIREDTVSGKVYFVANYGFGYDDKEILLYNFNANTSDTVWRGTAGPYQLVDSTDYIEISSSLHKRLWLDNKTVWIEGIGALNGLITDILPLPLCGTYYSRTLLCFYNSGALAYQPSDTVNKECYYKTEYVGVDKNRVNQAFTFGPNPAREYIIINSVSEGNFTVEITSLHGQLIMRTSISGTGTKFDLHGNSPGIYFLRVFDREQLFTYKLVIL